MEANQKPLYYVNVAKIDGISVHDIKVGLGTKKNSKKPNDADIDFYFISSPQHFKALTHLMAENLRVYEQLFGEIKLEPNEEALKELNGKIEVAK